MDAARDGVSPPSGEPARSRYLSPAARDLLSTASVLGAAFSVVDLEALTGRTAAQLAPPLREALATGALAESGRLLAFRSEHDRAELYGDIPLALRDAMHRDLARHALLRLALADGLFLAGDWDGATAEFEAGARLAPDHPVPAALRLGTLALMAVHRDELSAARAHLAAARRALGSRFTGTARSQRTALASALVAETAGRPREALTLLAGGWRQCTPTASGATVSELGPELVRRLVAAAEPASASEATAVVERAAAGSPDVPGLAGAALLCRGLAERDPGLLLDAVAAYRGAGRPLGLASACEDAAAALAASGAPADARELLAEAQEHYGGLGAVRCVARTAASLRALGVRPGVRAPRARATVGWEALTGTERKVVALVADRLTNPEIADRMFLSRRTVETHVSHALAKLGLRSRVELAAAATAHAELAGPRDGATAPPP